MGKVMQTKAKLLKASIEKEERHIVKIYEKMSAYPIELEGEEQTIVVAYFLNNLYSAFEQISLLVTRTFENEISDPSKWHSLLLRRMSLAIEGVRPELFSEETCQYLDRLRSFRHIFRNAYVIILDPEEITLLRKKAVRLRERYPADLARFKAFLEHLTQ